MSEIIRSDQIVFPKQLRVDAETKVIANCTAMPVYTTTSLRPLVHSITTSSTSAPIATQNSF